MYISHQAIGFFILFVLIWAFAYAVNRWMRDRVKRPPALPSRRRPLARRKPVEADQFSKLLNICFGDRAKAERLIQYELSRNPKLSRYAAIAEAIDRIKVDNRYR